MEEELAVECAANAAYEYYRAHGRQKNGRRPGAPPKAYVPPETPQGKINLTDLDSCNVKTRGGYMQGLQRAGCRDRWAGRDRRRDLRQLASFGVARFGL